MLEGAVADVLLLLLFWSVAEVELWVEGCVALCPCVPEVELELLPVCAARQRLASNRGEASHSFFIAESTSMFLAVLTL